MPRSREGNAIHPRFGPIRTVVATKDIKKGSQILCHYQYTEENVVPKWYVEVYKQEYGRPWPGKNYIDETDDDM